MKIERFKLGSGITERTVERKTAETHEDALLLFTCDGTDLSYPKYLDQLERQAAAYLQRKGLPHALSLIDVGNGWEQSRPIKNVTAPVRGMILPKAISEMGWAEDSWPGFAARIIWQVHRIRSEAQNGNVWKVADLAQGLGTLVTQSNIKRRTEKTWLHGGNMKPVCDDRNLASRNATKKAAAAAGAHKAAMLRAQIMERRKAPMPEFLVREKIREKWGDGAPCDRTLRRYLK